MTKLPPRADELNGPYDTAAIRSGAIEYIECAHCGAKPAQPCRLTSTGYTAWTGKPLTGFAHGLRRVEYVKWQDIYGPATRCWEWVPPEVRDRRGREIIHTPPCSHPQQHCIRCSMCACGVPLRAHDGAEAALKAERKAELEPKKSSSDVDDLLG
jgi:hypothetical protein